MELENARSSAHLYPSSSSFTAINHAQQNVIRVQESPRQARSSSLIVRKHPKVVAQYLGLGSDDIRSSHLDQLADVNVSPPPSPSEKNIPKRKRAGERIAKEVKQAAKRSRSSPDDEDLTLNDYHANKESIRPKTARRRSSVQSWSEEDHDTSHLTGLSTGSARTSEDVSLSQNNISRLNSWHYEPHGSSTLGCSTTGSLSDGVLSLVSPATSMDKFQAPSKRAEPLSRVIIKDTPIRRHNLVESKSRPHARRAPSTGRALQMIPEEPLSDATSRARFSKDITNFREPVECCVGRRDTSSGGVQPSIRSSQSLVSTATETFPPVRHRHEIKESAPVRTVEDDFDDLLDLDDEDLMELECIDIKASPVTKAQVAHGEFASQQASANALPTPQASDDAIHVSSDDDNDEDGWSQLADDDLRDVGLVNPTITQEHHLDQAEWIDMTNAELTNHRIHVDAEGSTPPSSALESTGLAPFARPTFPGPILDRSPLLNITSNMVLKTCFRIGEAINVGAHYARQTSSFTSDSILIELYARVVCSSRPPCHSGLRQKFVFTDLWAKKGPTLQGEWTGWKGNHTFEDDAKALLTDDDVDLDVTKMCRTVGRMKREKKEWIFVVLSAWECGWEDVEYARGIVCRE